MIEITNYEIRKTSDYELFKGLDGNRYVIDRRKDKIKKSISEIGYLLNPIIVNEKMEIIDGQGRFKALSELGMPIYYIVQEGVGLEHCRYLNMYNEKWTVMDFIKSYSKTIPDYTRLESLVCDYHMFGFGELFCALYNGIGYCNGGYGDLIRSGNFKASEEMFQNARRCLDYVNGFLPYINFKRGNKQNINLSKALMFCFFVDEIDKNILYRQFKNYSNVRNLIKNASNQKEALDCVGNVYNYNARKREEINLRNIYKKYKKREPLTHIR